MIGHTFQRFNLIILICLLGVSCVRYKVVTVPYKPRFDYLSIKKIAVIEFSNYSTRQGAGRIIADRIENQIVSESRYEVINRMQLNHILQEHRLSLKGVLSPATVRRVGKLAGVDALVVGNIERYQMTNRSWAKTYPGGSVFMMHKKQALIVFAFKVLDTTTGKVIYADTARGDYWREASEQNMDYLEKYSDYEYLEMAMKDALRQVKNIYPHTKSYRVRAN